MRRCKECHEPLPEDAKPNTRYHRRCRPSRQPKPKRLCACGCGRAVTINRRGRPRQYYDDAHRQRHHRTQPVTRTKRGGVTLDHRGGRPPKLIKCFGCPPDHEGWRRSELRTKNRILYCPEHHPDNSRRPLPLCPSCGDADFGTRFRSDGGIELCAVIEACIVTCEVCGFVGRALDYFDSGYLQLVAKRIDPSVTSRG